MNAEEQRSTPNVSARTRLFFRVRLTMLGTGLLTNILILAGAVDPLPGVGVFIGSVVAYLGINALFWRCPSCNKYPGNAVMPDFCEQCGSPIFGPDASVPDRPPSHPAEGSLSLRWILVGRAAYGLMLLLYFLAQHAIERISTPLFWVGMVVLLAGGVWVEWRWWRCPRCGGYLRRSLWPGRKCTKCGGELRF